MYWKSSYFKILILWNSTIRVIYSLINKRPVQFEILLLAQENQNLLNGKCFDSLSTPKFAYEN
jgi:hypothetical protein